MTTAAAVALLASACGSYDSVDDENGRLAIIEQANQYLNAAMCDQAIDLLMPLYWSRYVDSEVRMTLASGYACKAEFSFPTVLAAFQNTGTDIRATLVKAMYAPAGDTTHLRDFTRAADFVRETATVAGSLQAADRSSDANIYMVMMQTGVISSVISVEGLAVRTTGKKTQAINVAGTSAATRCSVQVAFTTIINSLASVSSIGTLTTLRNTATSLCGAGCSNLSYSTCLSTAAYQTEGAALLTGIDAQWQM